MFTFAMIRARLSCSKLIIYRFYASEAIFKTSPYKLHCLDVGPLPEVKLTTPEALQIYERMTTIRKLEATSNKLYKSKIIRGFCHLYSGQEAVAVGVFASLRPQDTAITSYRSHAWAYLFNGLKVETILAELIGVQSGSERGKGGSMHLFAKQFYGGNGIVGAQVSLGTGIALAHKYNNTDAVSVTIYGDGASNNGQVFESFNMAKLWNLPCLFMCENNKYAMGTSVSRHTTNPNFYTKGDLIPGVWMDGMDVFSVKEAVRFCIEHITSGKGPILLEASTYRYSGHSLSDPGTSYRTREEVSEVRKARDPITGFKTKILEANLVTEDDIKNIEQKAKDVVDKAEKTALADKEIGVEELTYDIYSKPITNEVRGVSPFKNWTHKTNILSK